MLILRWFVQRQPNAIPSCHYTTPTEALVREYSALVRRPYPDPAWRFYTAFLFFKNAVVLQGVEARRRQGVASSKLAIKLLDLAPVLVDISSTHLAEIGEAAAADQQQEHQQEQDEALPSVVVFDWGGVLTQSSPLRAIRDYEQLQHLPKGYVSVAIHAAGDRDGLFQRLERGKGAGLLRWLFARVSTKSSMVG